MTYKQIERCRICGNQDLAPIIDLGTQTLNAPFVRDFMLPLKISGEMLIFASKR